MITAALFPPSSRMVRPNLLATSAAIDLPTAVEPVKLISGNLRSDTNWAPTEGPSPATSVWMEVKPNLTRTSLIIFYVAIAQRQVVRAGFQTIKSPQIKAIAAFQPLTATGKLKAVMQPMSPSGFHCSIMK